eukprot:2672262-Amphidinium_carterae.2
MIEGHEHPNRSNTRPREVRRKQSYASCDLQMPAQPMIPPCLNATVRQCEVGHKCDLACATCQLFISISFHIAVSVFCWMLQIQSEMTERANTGISHDLSAESCKELA